MDDHVTPRHRRRAWFGGPVRIGVVVVLGALGAGVVRAQAPVIDRAAEAVSTAERVVTAGEGLLFPIEPTPMCEVLNNYGGVSKSGQSGGHQGVDIGAQVGQEVYAVEDGVLYRQWTDPGSSAGLGWGLWSITDVKYRYFHLDAFADGLEEGDEVVRGQLIGYVGDTGNATPGGWHLHFEVRPGPQPRFGTAPSVDPVPLLDIPTVCNVY
ncbi:MAG: M23 family metallopeptidase [Acidimicrobiia bacterium]